MSERYLCLACWRLLAREETFFRCAACEDAGAGELPPWLRAPGGRRQRLREVAEPWWRRWLADDDRPAGCPRHPGAEVRLSCVCGYPLSERAAVRRGAPWGLAVAGPRGAGKTLFLLTLMHELQRLEVGGRRLGAIGLDDTEARFDRLAAPVFDAGAPPRPSAAAELDEPWQAGAELPPANLAWTLDVAGGERRTPPLLLAVYDLGGAAWERPSHETDERLDRFLGLVGALVFLVDGVALARDLGHDVADAWDRSPPHRDRGSGARLGFGRLVERLGKRARQVDLALVVAKADALWSRTDVAALAAAGTDARREGLAELLRAGGREALLAEARRRFRAVELFMVSSLGFLPAAADVDAGGRLCRPPAPAKVTEPMAWLLDRRLQR